MAMANDMTVFMKKVEEDLHMTMLMDHLPDQLQKPAWEERLKTKTYPTFSRYFPKKIPFTVNKDTCNSRREHGKQVYYIRDDIFGALKITGVEDLDWSDTSGDQVAIAQVVGQGCYRPTNARLGEVFSTFYGYQQNADTYSLYNNNIYLDFEYPNKIILSRVGNTHVVLNSFVVNLLAEHSCLATISPTKMETFEALAEADIAEFLYGNLKYVDNLETTFININLLLDDLKAKAESRRDIIEQLENSYVSAANDNIPYIMTVNG